MLQDSIQLKYYDPYTISTWSEYSIIIQRNWVRGVTGTRINFISLYKLRQISRVISTIISVNTVNARANMKNRLYPRILFQQPLEGYLVIHTINEQAIDSNKRKVKIHNIGLGGLSFSTDLDFPMKDGISLTLKVDILSLGTVSGELAWKQKKYNDTYYYGLKAIVCNLNYLKGCLNATIVGETPYKPFNNRVL